MVTGPSRAAILAIWTAVTQDQRPAEPTEAEDLTRHLRLVLIALVSAAVTAVLVIAAGGAWLDRPGRASVPSPHDSLSEPVP